MNGNPTQLAAARRSFLGRLGAVVLGSTVASLAAARDQPAVAHWQPTRHAQDDWFDQLPGEHRFLFDTTTPEGVDLAIRFARNYYLANELKYGLKDKDLAVVIVARHRSTPFGFNDRIGGKYGKQLSKAATFKDPKTRKPPTVNTYATPGGESAQAGPLDALIKRGVQIAVCEFSTREIAGVISSSQGVATETIFTELAANLISNARLVPAGIVAVNRAQERGYSFVYAN
jgi:hypothetical protein